MLLRLLFQKLKMLSELPTIGRKNNEKHISQQHNELKRTHEEVTCHVWTSSDGVQTCYEDQHMGWTRTTTLQNEYLTFKKKIQY